MVLLSGHFRFIGLTPGPLEGAAQPCFQPGPMASCHIAVKHSSAAQKAFSLLGCAVCSPKTWKPVSIFAHPVASSQRL